MEASKLASGKILEGVLQTPSPPNLPLIRKTVGKIALGVVDWWIARKTVCIHI